jgi:hypothetical protein
MTGPVTDGNNEAGTVATDEAEVAVPDMAYVACG